MIIYCVQITIADTAEAEWLNYMTGIHIPDVLRTGCFESYEMLRETDFGSPDTSRYLIHYRCTSMAQLERYLNEFAAALREDVQKHFGGQFTAERRVYEVI